MSLTSIVKRVIVGIMACARSLRSSSHARRVGQCFVLRLNSERLLRRRWFAPFLLVQLVAQDGGVLIHFLSHPHDLTERTMRFPDAPRHYRSSVRSFQIRWL